MEKNLENFKQYHLGNLPAEKCEAIDLSLLTDDSPEADLEFAAHNLMEDFLENTLTPQEILLFHQNFLVNDERKNELENIRLLKKYAQNSAAKQSVPMFAKSNFGTNLINFFTIYFRPSAGIAGILLIGLLIGFYFFRSGENPAVSLNKRDLSNLSEFQSFSKLGLISGNPRDSTGATKLSAANLTENVLLRLALPFEHNAFGLKILRDENEILRLPKVPRYQNPQGSEIRLLVPANELIKGSYRIEAIPLNSSDAPLYYMFTVE